MAEPNLTKLRKLTAQRDKLVYEAVKAGLVAKLSHEDQSTARAIQEHMHLKHVHNALEFADLREGEPYEITVNGDPVSPMAHVTAHATVKGQIATDATISAAFEKMVATGASAHNAEHVLCAMLMEVTWELQTRDDPAKARAAYLRKLKKLAMDSAFRKRWTRKFGEDHSVFE